MRGNVHYLLKRREMFASPCHYSAFVQRLISALPVCDMRMSVCVCVVLKSVVILDAERVINTTKTVLAGDAHGEQS